LVVKLFSEFTDGVPSSWITNKYKAKLDAKIVARSSKITRACRFNVTGRIGEPTYTCCVEQKIPSPARVIRAMPHSVSVKPYKWEIDIANSISEPRYMACNSIIILEATG
jgi:hypothetical protein